MFHTATEPSRQAVTNSSPSLEIATPTTSRAWPHTSLTFVPSDQLMYQTHPLAQPATPYNIIIVFLHQKYILESKLTIHSHLNCVSKPAMHMHKTSVYSLAFTTHKCCFPLVSYLGQMRENIPESNSSWVSCDTDGDGATFSLPPSPKVEESYDHCTLYSYCSLVIPGV